MNKSLAQYYRFPESFVNIVQKGTLSEDSGYFRFGADLVCYGRCSGLHPSASPNSMLGDALKEVSSERGTVFLPFDLDQVVDSLRYERYQKDALRHSMTQDAMASAYYFVRPLLPVAVRKHLQKIRLRDWDKLSFPKWPVDRTVDGLFEQLLLGAMRSQSLDSIPFIWFWPDGASSCAIMTHDVETTLGRDFCSTLMDINDSFGIKSSFQVVPERRYGVPPEYIASIKKRGFEVAVQDLNHDGHLFREHEEFLARVSKINAYGREYGADGFRSAVLYRNQDWYEALDFSYDMSVPNVAHLDPQRGGCCTVMPYFIGNILELPVTTTQDYSLFHILNDHSLDLWKRQTNLIMESHGLMSFIIHPDYIVEAKERETYEALLGYLGKLRREENVWIPLPLEVNRWWRERANMTLVEGGDGWRIEGQGKERARIAYASERDGKLVYSWEPSRSPELSLKGPHIHSSQA
jgi:hypothetical protein